MGGDHAERAVPAAAWTLCALPQQLTPRPTLATSSAAPPIAGVTKGSESVAVLSAAGAELLCLLGLLHSAVAGLHPGLQCCSMHRCGWLPEGPSALSSLHPPPPCGPIPCWLHTSTSTTHHAGIIAKYTLDQYMEKMDAEHPEYGGGRVHWAGRRTCTE